MSFWDEIEKKPDALQRIRRGDDLIDVWAEVGRLDIDQEAADAFVDSASSIQAEAVKSYAVKTLMRLLLKGDDSEKLGAARALLQHYRDEKRRLAAREIVREEDVLHESDLFGPWSVKKPGAAL